MLATKKKEDLVPDGSTSEMMHRNCLAEIDRLQEQKDLKHQEISRHHERILQLSTGVNEAQAVIASHTEQMRNLQEALADARTRHVVAKNTPAESIIAVKIAGLGEQIKSCQENLDQAKAKLEEHQEVAQEIADLKATIGRLEEEGELLAQDRAKMERLRDELFQKIGIEKRDQLETAFRDGLQRLEEIRQGEQKAMAEMAELASTIKTKLSAWPQHMQSLIVRYKPNHQADTPTGRILQAYLAYVQALEKEGLEAELHFTVSSPSNPFVTHKVDLLELLTLDKDIVRSIMHFADSGSQAVIPPGILEPKRRVIGERARQAGWYIEQESIEQKTW